MTITIANSFGGRWIVFRVLLQFHRNNTNSCRHISNFKSTKIAKTKMSVRHKLQQRVISGDVRYRLRAINVGKMKQWLVDTWQHIPSTINHRKLIPAVMTWRYSNPKHVTVTNTTIDHDKYVDNVTECSNNESVIQSEINSLKTETLKRFADTKSQYDVTNVDSVRDFEHIIGKTPSELEKVNINTNSDCESCNTDTQADVVSPSVDNFSGDDLFEISKDDKDTLKGIESSNNNASQSEDGIFQTLSKVYQIPEAALLWYRGTPTENVAKKPVIRADFVSRSDLMRRTQQLVESMKMASTNVSKEIRTYELCQHLVKYPDLRSTAIKEGVLPILFKFRKSSDLVLQTQARQGLAVVGYVNPPGGRGVRILTIDGGGTKGLVAIEALRQLQKSCGTDICNMFDYVCGVSTGSLIAAMVFMYHVPLDECEQLYKEFSSKMFTRNRIVGTGQLMWSHAFYSTEAWQGILRKFIGERMMIESAKDPLCPRMSAVSCLTNTPRLTNFIFRNYNLPAGALAQYPGNCKSKVWEVIRASSAAPGYYEEFQIGDLVHQDGGLFTNNPTALAIHECRLLWPDEHLQCVVSLGNGKYEPNLEVVTASKSSLRTKFSKVIASATDTEAVHTMLQDLMPPLTYFRFNPFLSEEFLLDEIRPEKWAQIQTEASMYFRKNKTKVTRAGEQLMLTRRMGPIVADYIREKLVK